jgi:hypothetical protein
MRNVNKPLIGLSRPALALGPTGPDEVRLADYPYGAPGENGPSFEQFMLEQTGPLPGEVHNYNIHHVVRGGKIVGETSSPVDLTYGAMALWDLGAPLKYARCWVKLGRDDIIQSLGFVFRVGDDPVAEQFDASIVYEPAGSAAPYMRIWQDAGHNVSPPSTSINGINGVLLSDIGLNLHTQAYMLELMDDGDRIVCSIGGYTSVCRSTLWGDNTRFGLKTVHDPYTVEVYGLEVWTR